MALTQQNKKFSAIIISIIVILLVFIVFGFLKKWHRSEIVITQEKEKVKFHEKIKKLEDNIDNLQTEIKLQKDEIIPSEEVEAVFDKVTPEVDKCEVIKNNVIAFFTYLDQQGDKKVKAIDVYQDSLKRLAENPPVFSDNSVEVLALIRSMSHFYRVLGKQNLKYIKQVVTEESEMLEPAMESFYNWFTHEKQCKAKVSELPSLDMLYNHSCFFINTLAGKSYMLRRSSKIRILTSYYSVLIIDKANDEGSNLYGYDIRANIALLQDDIKSHGKLLYKKKYLDNLNIIANKYPKQVDN